jgi:hypothetical protein
MVHQNLQEEMIFPLSDRQRLDLFADTGLYVRRAQYIPQKKAFEVIDRNCSVCLLADDLPGITILPDGKCNKCHDFELKQQEGNFDSSHVYQAIKSFTGKGKHDCVLAFSGGKDSAAALLTAVYIYGLRPIALLIDNGFIPKEVIENSFRFCESHGVPLIVETIDIKDFTRHSLKSGAQSIPCQSCIKQVFAHMAEACKRYDTKLIVGGHRFPPLAFPVFAYTSNPEHEGICCISPLLGLRISEERQLKWITDEGWTPVEIAGNTSNCKLIGYVEEHFVNNYGYNPHIYEVSKEIRAGFYSRAAGVKKVENHHISEEQRRDVEKNLALV